MMCRLQELLQALQSLMHLTQLQSRKQCLFKLHQHLCSQNYQQFFNVRYNFYSSAKNSNSVQEDRKHLSLVHGLSCTKLVTKITQKFPRSIKHKKILLSANIRTVCCNCSKSIHIKF